MVRPNKEKDITRHRLLEKIHTSLLINNIEILWDYFIPKKKRIKYVGSKFLSFILIFHYTI